MFAPLWNTINYIKNINGYTTYHDIWLACKDKTSIDNIVINKKHVNNIFYSSGTLLEYPCEYGNFGLIKRLVENGANVNLYCGNFTPLHIALLFHKCNIDIIKYLVEHGADVNAVSYLDVNFHKNQIKNNTVLHYACNNNDLDIVMYLIDKGAKINVPNADGRHPIDFAVSSKYNNIVQYMKSKGAYETAIKVDSFVPSYQRYPTFF